MFRRKYVRTVFKVVSTLLAVVAGQAAAGTYTARYPPTSATDEINGTGGNDTARPYAASALMAHRFWSNQIVTTENYIVSSCQSRSPANSWPEGCNPDGMASSLQTWAPWVTRFFDETAQQSALDLQKSALKNLGSANVAPIYGQADHWVTIWKIETDSADNITKVHWLDGGAAWFNDSSGQSYTDGFVSASSFFWKRSFYVTVFSLGSGDSYFNKFINMYEPPPDFTPSEVFRAKEPPSPLRGKEVVTRALARERAAEALRLGGVHENPELWTAFQNSSPMLPFEVNAVWPDGSAWNYYLVPFVNGDHKVVSMAILDGEKLTFQLAWALSSPQPFGGIAREQAMQLAHGALRPGEALGGPGILTWDPAGPASSPTSPYYEFPLLGQKREQLGAVRVRLDSGKVGVVDACAVSRRAGRPATCSR